MVGSSAHGGFSSNTEVAELAIKQANTYCEGLGKKMLLTHMDTGGVQGWSPQHSEIQFQCLAADDPAYTRNRMEKDPNTVIKVENQPAPPASTH